MSSVVLDADPDLLRRAAQERGWPRVLRQLGLAATPDNIRAFRARALELNIELAHLRSPNGLEAVPREVLRDAVDGAASQAQVLARLGLKPGGSTYEALARAAATHGIALPARRPYGVGPRKASGFRATDEEVRAAFARARSVADLLRLLGLVPRGDNYRVIKRRLSELGLDARDLRGRSWARGAAAPRVPIDELLVHGRPCSGSHLARRLIEEGLLTRSCASCGLTEWLGQPIPLELDHKNGDHDDNRLENLRLLCPNCHALTNTYRGRNIRRRRTLTPTPEC